MTLPKHIAEALDDLTRRFNGPVTVTAELAAYYPRADRQYTQAEIAASVAHFEEEANSNSIKVDVAERDDRLNADPGTYGEQIAHVRLRTAKQLYSLALARLGAWRALEQEAAG